MPTNVVYFFSKQLPELSDQGYWFIENGYSSVKIDEKDNQGRITFHCQWLAVETKPGEA